ncbi:dienelactone hydrolase family protein [Zavarzinella formosa]|uniref:dienelactone hydrolase family protein n=1 Tax=Zavarzinella formosa TaxID=360055 RepID=UPI0002DD22B3|nr:dienelactone hydrolase family protein [Zavarzinella formosa]
MRHLIISVLSLLFVTSVASAEIVAKNIEYKHGPVALEAVLIHDNASAAKRPGVLLVSELGAAHADARVKAAQIARIGYAVLSVDLYGKGVLPKDGKDAATKLGLGGKDRALVRARMAAAVELCAKIPQIDSKKLAGVGYGVGGLALLELARSGGELEGIVCIHCDLSAIGNDAKKIGCSVLVIVGSEDPLVPGGKLAAFEEEMRAGGVDWQMLRLGGVAGEFTNPKAGRDLKTGRAYDADADQRANDSIKTFLAEMFVPATKSPAVPVAKGPVAPKGVPDKAMKMLAHVDQHGDAPDGYEGGRTFGNFEKRLPADDKGRKIKYREWDVNPLRPGVNRGPERLVTGSDGSAYFTDDHYSTFKKIR